MDMSAAINQGDKLGGGQQCPDREMQMADIDTGGVPGHYDLPHQHRQRSAAYEERVEHPRPP
jgi:hypothetical protein